MTTSTHSIKPYLHSADSSKTAQLQEADKTRRSTAKRRSLSNLKSSKVTELLMPSDAEELELLRRENAALRLQVKVWEVKYDEQGKAIEAYKVQLKARRNKKVTELEGLILTQQSLIERLQKVTADQHTLRKEEGLPWQLDTDVRQTLQTESQDNGELLQTQDHEGQDNKDVQSTLRSSFAKTLAQHSIAIDPVEPLDYGFALDTVKMKEMPALITETISGIRKSGVEGVKRKEFINKLSAKLSQYLAST
jgi:hypothetical protein